MKILYLKPEHGRPFFYADPSELAVGESERPTGLLGWAERKWGLLSRAERKWGEIEAHWKESDGAVARWSRRAWEWLLTWKRPDEEMLARLGAAGAVAVRHPASFSAKKVQAAWRRYLARRARSHRLWLIVDGVLAPVTGLLFMILPGPNVVGFWFTYRAFNHYTIVRSLHRARWESPPPTFQADPALDAPVTRDGGPGHPAVEDAGRLREHLERRDPEDDADEPRDDPDFPAGSDARQAGRA